MRGDLTTDSKGIHSAALSLPVKQAQQDSLGFLVFCKDEFFTHNEVFSDFTNICWCKEFVLAAVNRVRSISASAGSGPACGLGGVAVVLLSPQTLPGDHSCSSVRPLQG